ncbi:MAG: glycosyltransferase family 2 protein [Armatimonadetes bacterium]|nr:glycosyltransferase family 2 protein [Armatimonadota bacterium]MDW8121904.1 glycosyltransferase family 2 protein [Armatimonadota bacterium]
MNMKVPDRTLSIVIPAYNEADRIEETLKAVRTMVQRLSERAGQLTTEVIVVDDGSCDGTAKRAQPLADRVIQHPYRKGKGAALKTGLSFAKGHILLFCDADVGQSAATFWSLVVPVLNDEADLTIASPPSDPAGGFGLVRKFAALLVRLWTGRTLAMPLSGQRAVKREVLAIIPLADGYAVETAMTISALQAGFRLLEVPLPVTHRRLGRTPAGFLHRARQLWDIIRWVLPYFLLRRRK